LEHGEIVSAIIDTIAVNGEIGNARAFEGMVLITTLMRS
jgi:hypothetical protein